MTETAPGGPVQSTAQIEARMLEALRDIRSHWAALLEPTRSGGNGAPSADEVTPLDRRISLRHEAAMLLNSWARVIVDDRNVAPLIRCEHGASVTMPWPLLGPTRPRCVVGRPYIKGGLHNAEGENVDDLCQFIQRWARWFSGHEAGEDATAELSDLAGRIKSAAAPKPREWIYLGDCPFVVEDWFCAGQVRHPRSSEEPDPDAFCSDCGQIGKASWWEEVITGRCLVEVPRSEVPALIYRTFGRQVSRPTLHRWIKSGELARLDYVRTEEHFDREQVIEAVATRWAS